MTPKADPFAERAARKRDEAASPGNLPAQGSPPAVPGGFSTGAGQAVTFAQGRADRVMTLSDLPDPVETNAHGPLSDDEEQILELCMRGVKQFENAWWFMAKALANINARRLYRKTHDTFEGFAKDVFKKSRPTAYEEMTAYAVGELLSARADKAFEEESNDVSARADTEPIGKKAAIALNPLTKDWGAEAAVEVFETITDATGKAPSVKALTGIIKQLPRKTEDASLDEQQLKKLAHELATQQTRQTTPPADEGGGPGGPDAVAGIRDAVNQLTAAHRALAPAKVKQALQENPEEAAKLLSDAEQLASKAADRARSARS